MKTKREWAQIIESPRSLRGKYSVMAEDIVNDIRKEIIDLLFVESRISGAYGLTEEKERLENLAFKIRQLP